MSIIVPSRWLLLYSQFVFIRLWTNGRSSFHFTRYWHVRLLFCRQLSKSGYWPSYKKRCSWGPNHFPESHLGMSLCAPNDSIARYLFFSCMTSSFMGAGSWRDSMRLQAISIGEDCNIRDRLWSEWGIQGHPWTGRVRRSLLWHRQLMVHATIESHLIPGEGWYIGRNVYCGRL